MAARRPASRRLERLVLPQLRSHVPADEELLVWAHVQSSDGRRGILMLTDGCCIAHWPQRDDVVIRWTKVSASRVEAGVPGELNLALEAPNGRVAVRLSATSRGQKRRAAHIVRTVAELTPTGVLDEVAGQATAEFPVPSRGMRGQVRRVVITTAGVLLILLGLAFATPVIPGPGILTILAGLALLASEYDWAKDLHHWARGHFERFLERLRKRRRRRSS